MKTVFQEKMKTLNEAIAKSEGDVKANFEKLLASCQNDMDNVEPQIQAYLDLAKKVGVDASGSASGSASA